MTLASIMNWVQPHALPNHTPSDPGLSFQAKEVLAAGNRLTEALRLEGYFNQLSAEFNHVDVLDQWAASRELVERAERDYQAALDKLRESRRRVENALRGKVIDFASARRQVSERASARG